MMPDPFETLPRLQTKRLLLRELQDADIDALFELRSHPDVNRFINRPIPASPQDALAFIQKIREGARQNQWLYWAITLKDDQELVGTISLWNWDKGRAKAEVGYELRPRFQKMGLMQEALAAVIAFAESAQLVKTIEAWTHEENADSQKLLEKFSFTRNSHLEKIHSIHHQKIFTMDLTTGTFKQVI